MAMCMPHPLPSWPAASSCPTASRNPQRRIPSISCSSKRKKKSSAIPRSPPSAKPAQLPPSQKDEFWLGTGDGASTLTALQPLAEEQETLLPQSQRLVFRLVDQKLAQTPRSEIPVQQASDPLLRFSLASYEPHDAVTVLPAGRGEQDATRNVLTDLPEDQDGPVKSHYDARVLSHDAADELKYGRDAPADVEYRDAVDFESEYEWVEVDWDESDDDSEADEGDSLMVYWEGGLQRMEKREEEISEKSDVDEDDGAYLEAEAALAQFEDELKKRSVSEYRQKTGFKQSQAGKHPNGPTNPTDDEESASEEDIYYSVSSKSGGPNTSNPVEDYEGEEEAGKKQQKRSIPAVMRSFDRVKIYAKAGDGGNGVVAFRREKFVPFGGPSGGSGGRGGHVFVRSDSSLNSLLCFRKSVHFRAGRGSHGMGKGQDGAAGVDCFIDVPLGTVLREAGNDISGPGEILLEVTKPGQCELLLPGGRGGRGNSAFKTGRNKTPQLAENGEQGAEMWLDLELKLVADVGIIGVPNAGKSTLLSVISAAQPTIGAYPFTTLLPNLGVVPIGLESTMVVADLPGLIEGAHLGIGLGHEFLRHTERCRALVHMVDGTSQQPELEYEAVRLELELFSPSLPEKPCIVAFNKMDIPEAADRWPDFQKYLNKKGVEPVCISAATTTGVTDVVNKAYKILQSLPSFPNEDTSEENASWEPGMAERIRKYRSAPIEEFEIIEDKATRSWRVQGVGLERFTQMTNWEYYEALSRFHHVLTVSGVNKALKERGVVEGDVVTVGQMELIWYDSEDIRSVDWKRSFRGSRLWPH